MKKYLVNFFQARPAPHPSVKSSENHLPLYRFLQEAPEKTAIPTEHLINLKDASKELTEGREKK